MKKLRVSRAFAAALYTAAILPMILYLYLYGPEPAQEASAPAEVSAAARLQLAAKQEQLYRDLSLTLLYPSIDAAVKDFYQDYFKVIPHDDIFSIEILDVSKPEYQGAYTFQITLELMPYLGPHNSVGRDRITFLITPSVAPQVVSFEHLESFALPENYADLAKGAWPPE